MRPALVVRFFVGAVALSLAAACSAGSTATPSSNGTSTTSLSPTIAKTPTAADYAMLDTIKVSARAAGTAADPSEPTVTFTKEPVSVSTTTVKVLDPGTGTKSKPGDRVKVRQVLYLGNNGTKLDSSYGEKLPASFLLSGTDTIPGLISALTGVQKGARILFVIPPAQAFGNQGRTELGISGTDNLVVVADIIDVTTPSPVLSGPQGTPVTPPAGLPTVTDHGTSAPTITVPKTTPPTETVSQLLIDGNGATVEAGQEITVDYVGVLWRDGKVFDSTWSHGSPATFQIGVGSVIPGWDKTLVGKKVGSRVLIIIPPKDGYGTSGNAAGGITGTDTLVFVVDILAAS